MPRLLALLALVTLAGATPYPAPPLPTPIRLPLEVIGPDGYTEAVTIDVPDVYYSTEAEYVFNADRLYLQVHRPVYRDAGVNSGRGPKASVRLNGGPWVGLTNDVVECFDREAAYGCLSGVIYTARITVDLYHFGQPGLQPGQNTIEFRFNGTDGLTIGYRVLELNLLDVAGHSVFGPDTFVHEDPATWTPPRPDPADIIEGNRLWHEAELVEGSWPGAPEIRATCSSCHARDGRDLKYFAYSNWAIQERAKHHGLSQVEAEQIASYIRSLDVPAPELGRPWNPPFQPGPGLDQRPAEEWSAGAGLDAVLDSDAEMREHLFPGESLANVAADATLNVRETPIGMQLPDWNAWLPTVHPVDVWGDFFLATAPVDSSDGDGSGDVLGWYERLMHRLETEGPLAMHDRGDLLSLIDRFTAAGITHFWIRGEGGQNLPGGLAPEIARRSIRSWTVVKLWEAHREFDLEALATTVYSEGEARSWLGGRRSVFDLSPKDAADGYDRFAWQTTLEGRTESTQWYQTQLTVNSGNRTSSAEQPIDWNYHPTQINGLLIDGGPAQAYRAAEAWAKNIQLFHNRTLVNEAFARQTHPGRYGDMRIFWPQYTDVHTRAALFNALLSVYMDAVESRDISEWNRPEDPNILGYWEAASYLPVTITNQSWTDAHTAGRYADLWYTMIPEYRAWGVDVQVLDRMIAWGAQMWPLADWEALDGPQATLGRGDGLMGTYYDDTGFVVPIFQRADPYIQFHWPNGTAPGSNMGHETFSIRWTGYVLPLFGGPTTFHVRGDDGFRLWVDGELVVDHWYTYGYLEEDQGTITLPAGEIVPIRLEYVERQGSARIELRWSSPWFLKTIVPQNHLYTVQPQARPRLDHEAVTAASTLAFALEPGRPNPFGTSTTLTYALPEAGTARLEVYDLLGRRVAVLADGVHEAGWHTATLEAADLASGTYVCRLQAGDAVATQKVLVLR
jgi:hypothetical protein